MHAIQNSHKIERDSKVPRRGRGEQGLEGPRTEYVFDVNTNEMRCDCPRRENLEDKFVRRQGWDAGHHEEVRGDGARARDESGRTGLGRWRDTPRIQTNTRTPVQRETTRKLDNQTSRAQEVCFNNACMNNVYMTSPHDSSRSRKRSLTRHNHKGLALWWLITFA